MENERSSFMPHWRDLGDFILPRRPRWLASDTNKGDRRNQKIIDSTATYSQRILRSGMVSGLTSPARPWFRVATEDLDRMDSEAVKDWCFIVTERMRQVFNRSNLYNSFPLVYGDLSTFATAACFAEEDFDTVLHTNVFPIGSYCISVNGRGRVDCMTRRFNFTVKQIVGEFIRDHNTGALDWSKGSDLVKNLWDRGLYEEQLEIVHTVLPNAEWDQEAPESQYKKYQSVYYELGGGIALTPVDYPNYMLNNSPEESKFLRIKGYDRFPVLAPRWEVTGEDAYGTDCPGMVALGDIKQLQLGERRIAQALEKMVNPPMVAPASLRVSGMSILPGDTNYTDVREGQQGIKPAHEVNPQVLQIEQKQEQVRQRVKKAFFEDLFLMLASSDRREITAREIEERHEEKLWALGPVLERMNQDMLDPLIDMTFGIMLKRGMVPPPPQELRGQNLKIEYVSVMAQAQKLIGLASLERFSGFVGQIATANPNVLDKIDFDHLVDVYGDSTGVAPGIVLPDEKVAQIRQQRQQQQQQQQQLAAAQQQAATAKDLSSADMSGDNALTRAIGGMKTPMQGGM